jgi:hypothetical protein
MKLKYLYKQREHRKGFKWKWQAWACTCVCVIERGFCTQNPKLHTNLLQKDGDKYVGHQSLVSDFSTASKTSRDSSSDTALPPSTPIIQTKSCPVEWHSTLHIHILPY